jgi:2-hydroxy-4-carboxymuconate semialdehyde hemiacetal dehydrogenase
MHGEPRSWVDNLLWHHGCHSVDLAQWLLNDSDFSAWGQHGPLHKELRIPMDMTIGMRSNKTGALFTMALSFNNRGPFGSFYRYIGEEDTFKVFRDAMTNSEGRQVNLDQTPAYDRQDAEFISAIREGHEPEAAAASCLPAMELLEKIQKSMDAASLAR